MLSTFFWPSRRTLDDAEVERNSLRLKLQDSEHDLAGIVASIKVILTF